MFIPLSSKSFNQLRTPIRVVRIAAGKPLVAEQSKICINLAIAAKVGCHY